MLQDRNQAGQFLAKKLLEFKNQDVLVLAIPRGGVAVARSLADRLGAPLGVVVTKKIGAPDQEELAIGAVGPEGEVALDEALIQKLAISEAELEKQIQKAKTKVQNYKLKFKNSFNIQDKTVILVDDGIATGATVKAAIKHLYRKKVKKLILAVPIVPKDTLLELKSLVDELVVLETPSDFQAVGEFYEDFPQISDEEALGLIRSR